MSKTRRSFIFSLALGCGVTATACERDKKREAAPVTAGKPVAGAPAAAAARLALSEELFDELYDAHDGQPWTAVSPVLTAKLGPPHETEDGHGLWYAMKGEACVQLQAGEEDGKAFMATRTYAPDDKYFADCAKGAKR